MRKHKISMPASVLKIPLLDSAALKDPAKVANYIRVFDKENQLKSVNYTINGRRFQI